MPPSLGPYLLNSCYFKVSFPNRCQSVSPKVLPFSWNAQFEAIWCSWIISMFWSRVLLCLNSSFKFGLSAQSSILGYSIPLFALSTREVMLTTHKQCLIHRRGPINIHLVHKKNTLLCSKNPSGWHIASSSWILILLGMIFFLSLLCWIYWIKWICKYMILIPHFGRFWPLFL